MPLFQITKDHFSEIASCSDFDEEEIIEIETEIFGDREEIKIHLLVARTAPVQEKF